jgi:ABC-type phosphate/phosphonate transport system ATPase subunit
MSATANGEVSSMTSELSQRRRQEQQAFRIHVGVFAGTMLLIFTVNLLTNLAAGITGQWGAWWSAYALFGWSIAITIHGLMVRWSHSVDSTS